MQKFTIDDLKAIKAKCAHRLAFTDKTYLLICGGTGCHATGSITKSRMRWSRKSPLKSCRKRSRWSKPAAMDSARWDRSWSCTRAISSTRKLKLKIFRMIVQDHLINGKPIEKLMYKDPVTKKYIPEQTKMPFFSNQMPRALRNKGLINPESIDDYIAREGYLGAFRALAGDGARPDCRTDEDLGMRGRGGAGFPTGLKWDFASKSPGEIKYVLCNADEGDPGAFMDRSILEADPHAVLEGMIIAAKAINARKGYIYARTEYPLAIKRLQIAIEQATERGLLGRISWAPVSILKSRSTRAPARLYAEKKPP
jgi:hypothetical protein